MADRKIKRYGESSPKFFYDFIKIKKMIKTASRVLRQPVKKLKKATLNKFNTGTLRTG
ncbi:hypothetical protein [Elizabethkingia miricola]|uniref:hypothetical protein n=1 Tax=Elizabethkingia miricola TaxID=172045 RepID=UPI003891D9E3